MNRSGLRAWMAAALGGAIGVAAATAFAVDRATPSTVSDVTATAVTTPVTVNERSASTAVAVKVNLDTAQTVVLNRSGVLTWLDAGPGSAVTNGQVVARIDGQPIIAMASDAAPHRSLGVGDTGADVNMLESWLAELEMFADPPDRTFDQATAAALRRWQKQAGVKVTGGFDLASVAWIGHDSGTVEQVAISPGREIGGGEVLLTMKAAARSVSVYEPAGGVQQEGDQQLVVGKVQVPYVPGSGVVSDAAAAAKIVPELGVSGEGVGRVVAKTAIRVKTVPASAVVTDSEGRSCVFESAGGPAVAVTASGGGLGGVDLPESTPITSVLVNPALVKDNPTCS